MNIPRYLFKSIDLNSRTLLLDNRNTLLHVTYNVEYNTKEEYTQSNNE